MYESIVDYQSKLAIITGLTLTIIPAPASGEIVIYQEDKVLVADTLNRMALANRTDLKIAQKQVEVSGFNVKWQKSLSVPDITVGALWDQRGGTFKNEVGLNLGIPLPLWNRNQGNIKIARAQLSEATVQQTLQQKRPGVWFSRWNNDCHPCRRGE